jgi:hypothetical protein
MFSHQNIHKYTWNSPEYFSNNLTLMIIYLQNSKCENTMLLKNYVNVDISLKLKIVNYSHQNSIILYSAKQSTVSCHCCSNSWILLYIHTHIYIYIKLHRQVYPWERLGMHCIGVWVGSRASVDGCGKSPPPGFDPPTFHPILSRYWVQYPGPHIYTYMYIYQCK